MTRTGLLVLDVVAACLVLVSALLVLRAVQSAEPAHGALLRVAGVVLCAGGLALAIAAAARWGLL